MTRESKFLIGIIVAVVAVMVGAFVLANNSSDKADQQAAADAQLVRDDSHKTGSGAVTLVEFGDFQCPACGAAEPNIEKIRQEYPDKVTVVFRNFPLTQIHKNANTAALAAEAAAAQGKYWEFHDKLYATQTAWSETDNALDYFVQYAKDLGLNSDQLKSDVESKKYQSMIDQGTADGTGKGVQGTPTIFVNGTQVSGYQYADIKAAVDKALGAPAK